MFRRFAPLVVGVSRREPRCGLSASRAHVYQRRRIKGWVCTLFSGVFGRVWVCPTPRPTIWGIPRIADNIDTKVEGLGPGLILCRHSSCHTPAFLKQKYTVKELNGSITRAAAQHTRVYALWSGFPA